MANSSGQYTVTEIIDALRSNKLVPSKTADSTLRGLKGHFERLQQGTELKDWGCDGRPPLKSILEVEELVDNHAGSVGPIDMKASLKKAHTDQLTGRGFSTLGAASPCKKTNQRYMHLARAQRTGVAKTTDKSLQRYIAERSLRGLAAEAAVLTSMLYRPCEVGEHAEGDDLTNLLAIMAAEAFGVKQVMHIHPALVINTDDTTSFVCANPSVEQAKDTDFRVASEAASSTYANFKLDEYDTFIEGIRVKLTLTTNAVGQCAGLWATAANLNERELDPKECPSGVLIVKIPGFAIGAATKANSQEVSALCPRL